MTRTLRIIIAATLVLPSLTFASDTTQVVSEIAGLFNIFVGIMFVIACLLFISGMLMWSVRLGVWPSHRDEAIELLEWAVATLFTLVVLLGIVEYTQRHTQQALQVIGVIFVGLFIWLLVSAGVFSGAKKEEKE